ncbi:O-antigen ligase family protein [Novosphingobium sp. SL115]|uniref:O-antigen ligase family protein n=1 Tax=Novosphingobium sp. SL115 TaxID=2995150 RepID=UPI0022760AA1|nr:O-antigen ligase family protein [Novosphingobium sp. SL115]MCY1669491.1 O-antigen ligase family protein [Novosphingobium sp. SL115]
MPSRWPFAISARLVFVSLWLLAIFMMGGTSRPDTQSLLILRPLSVLIFGAGAITLQRAQFRAHRTVFIFAALVLLLPAIHLVPLPPAWWSALPGRGLIVDIDAAVGLTGTWRPISMSPPWTWNALWSLFVPLSVVVHVAQLETRDIRRLGVTMLGIGLASAVLAIAQVSGDPRGPLYFYRKMHFGVADGFFANRNHQAVFLAALFPIAMACLRYHPLRIVLDQRGKKRLDLTRPAAVVLIFVLVPLVLTTGSRSGIVAMVISVVGSLLVLSPFGGRHAPERGLSGLGPSVGEGAGAGTTGAAAAAKLHRRPAVLWTVLVVCAGLAMTGIALSNDRALSIERLIEVDPQEDMRTKILPTVFSMIRLYAPGGSGVGTFEPVYQIHEPDELLMPTYANHIHNDWLEVVMTAGVPGGALLAWAVLAWFGGAAICLVPGQRRVRPGNDMARAALIVILLTGLASISDYPLRTPAFSALFAVMLIWLTEGLRKTLPDHARRDRLAE